MNKTEKEAKILMEKIKGHNVGDKIKFGDSDEYALLEISKGHYPSNDSLNYVLVSYVKDGRETFVGEYDGGNKESVIQLIKDIG